MNMHADTYPAPESLRRFMQAWPLQRWTDDQGLRWAWRDSGGTAPCMALLPGALGNGDVAWKVAEALAPDALVLTIHYPSGASAQALSAGLHGLLQHVQAGLVALWGSSYGAWWAQQFVHEHADDVRALWLGNTLTDGTDVSSSPLFDPAWLAVASAEEVLQRWHQATIAKPDSELRQLQLYMLHHGLPAEDFRQRLLRVANAPTLPAQTAVPRIVVSGCADDAIITPAVSARVQARYPGAQVVGMPVGGHYPHVTQVDVLLPQLRHWAGI